MAICFDRTNLVGNGLESFGRPRCEDDGTGAGMREAICDLFTAAGSGMSAAAPSMKDSTHGPQLAVNGRNTHIPRLAPITQTAKGFGSATLLGEVSSVGVCLVVGVKPPSASRDATEAILGKLL